MGALLVAALGVVSGLAVALTGLHLQDNFLSTIGAALAFSVPVGVALLGLRSRSGF